MKMSKSEAGKLGGIAATEGNKKRKLMNINEYMLNPKKCKQCFIEIDYKHRYNDFCSRSCSARKNNLTGRPSHGKVIRNKCLNCENLVSKITNKFCSQECSHDFKMNESIRLNAASSSTTKKYLIKLNGSKCMECGWCEVNKKTGKVPIEIEHIDGNHENNLLSNLKLLCPNCHSLTSTYKALNVGNGRASRRKRYKDGKSF